MKNFVKMMWELPAKEKWTIVGCCFLALYISANLLFYPLCLIYFVSKM